MFPAVADRVTAGSVATTLAIAKRSGTLGNSQTVRLLMQIRQHYHTVGSRIWTATWSLVGTAMQCRCALFAPSSRQHSHTLLEPQTTIHHRYHVTIQDLRGSTAAVLVSILTCVGSAGLSLSRILRSGGTQSLTYDHAV